MALEKVKKLTATLAATINKAVNDDFVEVHAAVVAYIEALRFGIAA